LLCVAFVSGTARADALDDAAGSDVGRFAAEVAKRSLKRTRRSVTLGPIVGVAPGVTVDDGELDAQLSFGVGLLRYDIPLFPTPSRMKDILLGRARVVFEERVKAALVGGGPLTDDDKKRIARETWEEIKAEFLLEMRPRRLEKPSFELMVEVLHAFDAEAWDVRATAGFGVGPVYLAAGTSLQYDEGAALVIPLEISKPVLLSKGLRAPVINAFVRYELAATDREARTDRVFVGARFMLDVL
jgi:hypothetical protein